MNAKELKRAIMDRVSSIESEELLKEIYERIKTGTNVHSIYKLSKAESVAIAKGLADLRDGRVHTSEHANAILRASLIEPWKDNQTSR